MSAAQRYAFGDFVLERSQQRVRRRDGSPLELPPRLFSALLLFVENAGTLLDKDALMRALWPGLVVEENSLSQVISGLRRALDDDSHDSRYIQTVPRRGFRFIAPVTELPDSTAPEHLPAAAIASGRTPSRCRHPLPSLQSGRQLTATADPCQAGGACCGSLWPLVLPRSWEVRRGGYRAGRREMVPQRSSRHWPCCLSSRCSPMRVTNCWKSAWPIA